MTILRQTWSAPMMLATAGSLAGLAAAFFFQHVVGLAPCVLCILQRWPHAAAVLFGAASLALPPRWARLAIVGAGLSFVAGAAIAGYHVGVEQHWWAGPDACGMAVDVRTLSAEQLLAQLRSAPVVPCDEVAWSLLGVSMAGWNGVLSLALAGLTALALRSASGQPRWS